jgi:hypothetical protein
MGDKIKVGRAYLHMKIVKIAPVGFECRGRRADGIGIAIIFASGSVLRWQ